MQQGLRLKKICAILRICERRIQRWKHAARQERYSRKAPEGPREHKPYNALTPEEWDLVHRMIADAEYADASCRDLSVLAMEKHGTYISHVTFWEAMKAKGVNGPRGVYAKRRESKGKPDTSWATEPNQLWAWDITFIRTYERHVHFYLYVVIDRVSRKVVSWELHERLLSDVAKSVWDQGLLAEGLADKPSHDLPRSLSDRGSQMRSFSTKQFFKDLGIEQLYSRPRTPNDNPHIEAFFSTVKNHPAYPERFETLDEAREYFERFFDWYNNEHYHTSLQMIPPARYHAGEADKILLERQVIKEQTFANRRLHHAVEK